MYIINYVVGIMAVNCKFIHSSGTPYCYIPYVTTYYASPVSMFVVSVETIRSVLFIINVAFGVLLVRGTLPVKSSPRELHNHPVTDADFADMISDNWVSLLRRMAK